MALYMLRSNQLYFSILEYININEIKFEHKNIQLSSNSFWLSWSIKNIFPIKLVFNKINMQAKLE